MIFLSRSFFQLLCGGTIAAIEGRRGGKKGVLLSYTWRKQYVFRLFVQRFEEQQDLILSLVARRAPMSSLRLLPNGNEAGIIVVWLEIQH